MEKVWYAHKIKWLLHIKHIYRRSLVCTQNKVTPFAPKITLHREGLICKQNYKITLFLPKIIIK